MLAITVVQAHPSEDGVQPVASANAGSLSRSVLRVTGPAWLRFSLDHFARYA